MDDIAPFRSLKSNVRPQLSDGIRLHVDRFRGRSVLLFPEGVLQLNRTAESIVRPCDGQREVSDIVLVTLVETFATPFDDVSRDVEEFAGTTLSLL
jgi:pyrroloquinoline quinone biosynthesis protein D